MSQIPTEQELNQYLRSHGVEQFMTSVLEAVCFKRPTNVPEFVVDYVLENYPSARSFKSKSETSESKKVSFQTHNPNDDDDDDIEDNDDLKRSSSNNQNYNPFNFSSSNNSNKEEEENGYDLSMSESIRRRYSVSVDRRGGVSNESLSTDQVANAKKVVVKKSADERSRLEQSCSKLTLFKYLDEDELNTIYDAMVEKTHKAGDVIISQGDDGDFFYVVDSGECDILVQSGTSEPKLVKVAEAGDSFGELALIFGTPRAATVKAKTDVRLWAIDRITYRGILMSQTQKKRIMYEGFLKGVGILQNLTDYERDTVADALYPDTFKDGECIVKQGEPGNSFFIIVDGECIVTKKEKGEEEKEMIRLHKADYFGELALLFDQPRAATVRANGTVKVVKLERRDFKNLLGSCETILKRNMEQYNKIMAQKI